MNTFPTWVSPDLQKVFSRQDQGEDEGNLAYYLQRHVGQVAIGLARQNLTWARKSQVSGPCFFCEKALTLQDKGVLLPGEQGCAHLRCFAQVVTQ